MSVAKQIIKKGDRPTRPDQNSGATGSDSTLGGRDDRNLLFMASGPSLSYSGPPVLRFYCYQPIRPEYGLGQKKQRSGQDLVTPTTTISAPLYPHPPNLIPQLPTPSHSHPPLIHPSSNPHPLRPAQPRMSTGLRKGANHSGKRKSDQNPGSAKGTDQSFTTKPNARPVELQLQCCTDQSPSCSAPDFFFHFGPRFFQIGPHIGPQIGSRLVPDWCQIGARLVPDWERLGGDWVEIEWICIPDPEDCFSLPAFAVARSGAQDCSVGEQQVEVGRRR
jgi:hypothetical protein